MRHSVRDELVHAELRLAIDTGRADAARRNPRDDDVIAGHERGHSVAHRDDLAGAFVTEYGGQRDGERSVLTGEVRVADAARMGADPDFAGTRPFDIDVLVELDLFADGGKDRSAHGRPPGSVVIVIRTRSCSFYQRLLLSRLANDNENVF